MAATPAPAAAAPAAALELTGVLATTDSYGRLRLCLVDALDGARGARGAPRADGSWARLRAAVPAVRGYSVPYALPLGGRPDDSGVRGECWITLPVARGAAARDRRARLLALADELRGKEVAVVVRPRRFAFVSRAAHNAGDEVGGTALTLCGLEAYAWRI